MKWVKTEISKSTLKSCIGDLEEYRIDKSQVKPSRRLAVQKANDKFYIVNNNGALFTV